MSIPCRSGVSFISQIIYNQN